MFCRETLVGLLMLAIAYRDDIDVIRVPTVQHVISLIIIHYVPEHIIDSLSDARTGMLTRWLASFLFLNSFESKLSLTPNL